MLFVSYVPLVHAESVHPDTELERLRTLLNDAHDAYAVQEILWVDDPSEPRPVLVLKGFAAEVAQHLKEWSGGKPNLYFTLVSEIDEQRGASLWIVPNLDKATRRQQARTGDHATPLTTLAHVFGIHLDTTSDAFRQFRRAGSEAGTRWVGFSQKTSYGYLPALWVRLPHVPLSSLPAEQRAIIRALG